MKKKVVLLFVIVFAIFGTQSLLGLEIKSSTPLWEAYEKLGQPLPPVIKRAQEKAKQQDLVDLGEKLINYNNFKNPISKQFRCTHCHSTQIEDRDLVNPNPEDRLAMGAPILQGTSFKGIINRTSWYNGDWGKGPYEVFLSGRQDIETAIQLCSSMCSQGRKVDEKEMDAILAYFWDIQLKVGDLELEPDQLETLSKSAEVVKEGVIDFTKKESPISSLTKILESRLILDNSFSKASNATMVHETIEEIEAIEADVERGRLVFKHSCAHCHGKKDVRADPFDDNRLEDILDDKQMLIDAVRKSVGGRPYMPQFTKERLSTEQLADLLSYLESASEGIQPAKKPYRRKRR